MCNVSPDLKSPSKTKQISYNRGVWEHPSQITAVVKMFKLIIEAALFIAIFQLLYFSTKQYYIN
jgi:hypothetical protein